MPPRGNREEGSQGRGGFCPAPAALTEVNRLPNQPVISTGWEVWRKGRLKKIKRAVKSKRRDIQFESEGL